MRSLSVVESGCHCSSTPHLSLTPLDAKSVFAIVSRVLLQPSTQSCPAAGKSRRLPCLGVNGPPAHSLFVPRKSLSSALLETVNPSQTNRPARTISGSASPLSHPCPPFTPFAFDAIYFISTPLVAQSQSSRSCEPLPRGLRPGIHTQGTALEI
ncbi:hypothetical protein BDW66DRAFT_140345 [Aspergillus desertorum]